MDKKVLAIGVVAILLVAGAAIFFMLPKEQKAEYDPAKGWYSWDPYVGDYGTSEMTSSPNLLKATEKLYTTVYTDLPDYSKYTKVPDDFLKFDSRVSETSDSITVTSFIRKETKGTDYEEVQVTIPKGKNYHLVTVASTAALIKQMLETSLSPAEAEAKTWEYIYGLDKSAFPGASSDINKNYGMTIPEGVKSVSSTYNPVSKLDEYTGYVADACATEDDVFVLLCSGNFGASYADMQPFLDMLNAANPGKAYLVALYSTDLSDVFASIEIIGSIFDKKSAADDLIDDIRLHFYAMHQESSKLNKNYKVYVESTSGQGAGTGSIINDVVTSVLSLKNICKHEQWVKISDEIVIDEQPKVIIFQSSDKRTMDERMRVGYIPGQTETA
ncbi:iron ABC transporter substrate-binding protein [methanogenic archaeon mixed culture ISO4-G1]|nr:iron ABC transporter substrate-binding protein [methanogenic archaeon mixed culture ISO4-G1]